MRQLFAGAFQDQDGHGQQAPEVGRLVAIQRANHPEKLLLGSGRAFTGLSNEAALRIQELFRYEVEELERLVERDLSAWKRALTI